MGIWTDKIIQVEPADDGKDVIYSTPVKKEGLPVRCGGDRIYLLLKGKKHWIVNADAYEKLGFKFGDEREIDPESLQLFVEGEPIN